MPGPRCTLCTRCCPGGRTAATGAAGLRRERRKHQLWCSNLETLSPSLIASRGWERIRDWVDTNGGFVHPALLLSERTESGCRGVLAGVPISEADLKAEPLLVVPERLFITSGGSRDLPECLLPCWRTRPPVHGTWTTTAAALHCAACKHPAAGPHLNGLPCVRPQTTPARS